MRRQIDRVYPYVDQHGQLRMEIVRFATGEPKCLPRRPAVPTDLDKDVFTAPDGGSWIWAGPSLEHDEPWDVLYRLPELLAADKSRMVFVTEGERDADSIAELGLVAVTNAFGAGHWDEHHSKWLKDRPVCIVEDNDDAGRRRTTDLIGSLILAGVATLTVLRFPDLPPKGDVTDWLNHPAMQLFDAETRRQELITRVNNGVFWLPERRAAA